MHNHNKTETYTGIWEISIVVTRVTENDITKPSYTNSSKYEKK